MKSVEGDLSEVTAFPNTQQKIDVKPKNPHSLRQKNVLIGVVKLEKKQFRLLSRIRLKAIRWA